MHYVDEGAGPAVLCLHGEPTWGYLFRELIGDLSDQYRVIAPDHMGFGKSETPAGRTYWLQDHIDNMERLVLDLDLRDITLLMHDFGGPVGMGLASRQPDRIARIISVNGPTAFGQPDLGKRFMENVQESPWFQWILRAEAENRLEPVLNQLHYNILSTLQLNGFERKDRITDTWIGAYGSPFKNPEDCLGAIGWAKGVAIDAHRFGEPSEKTRLHVSALPAMAIWGTADRTLQAKHFLPLFRSAFPDGRVYMLKNAGHFSPEDAPETISLLVRQFLQGTGEPAHPPAGEPHLAAREPAMP